MSRVYDAALNEMWAMDQSALERLLSIAARDHEITDEALEAYRANTLANGERALIRDGVAVLNVEGPLFPKANLMTAISGATSYDTLMRDLHTIADANPTGLILNINSPGGAVTGVSEFAQAVYDMRGKFPIVAYVGGAGASAAYMIASAADRIVVNDMALLGSIGVQSTFDVKADDRGTKTYTFISSQSPMKNAGPETKAGAEAIQQRVDDLAQVFVETVARNRGVDTETALNNFGKGGIFVGEGAVKAGLADAVGSFESVLANIVSGGKPDRAQPQRKQGTRMSETTETTVTAAPAAAPAITAADVTAAATQAATSAMTAERSRIGAIQKFGTAHAVDAAVVQKAIDEGTTALDFANAVADAAIAKTTAAGTAALTALAADETKVEGVTASTARAVEGETAEDLASAIAAFAPGAPASK